MLRLDEYPAPRIIPGGLFVDDRGQLNFFNQFDLASAQVRRMYMTMNHQQGTVRAWHAHKCEGKYVMAISGSALVCAVRVLDWHPQTDTALICSLDLGPKRFVLSAASPAVLAIPPGYANGWMSLTDDAQLLWFSTATLEESKTDDYRFPARYWNPWKVEER